MNFACVVTIYISKMGQMPHGKNCVKWPMVVWAARKIGVDIVPDEVCSQPQPGHGTHGFFLCFFSFIFSSEHDINPHYAKLSL
jgi:hypothetical protein